jgi:hypothetical protein
MVARLDRAVRETVSQRSDTPAGFVGAAAHARVCGGVPHNFFLFEERSSARAMRSVGLCTR